MEDAGRLSLDSSGPAGHNAGGRVAGMEESAIFAGNTSLSV